MKPRSKAPVLQDFLSNPRFDILRAMQLANEEMGREDRYLSWDELRYRVTPQGLSPAEWWVGLKLHRQQGRRLLPFTDTKGRAFSYAFMQQMLKTLHDIDMKAGGMLGSNDSDHVSEQERNSYLLSSVTEEAIMSSILEGAAVTRAEAKEMLRTNRKPTNEYERAVLNNHLTMRYLMEKKGEPLTPELVLDIHRRISEGTLQDDSKCGRLREAADHVRIEKASTDEIIHVPPPAQQLPERLVAMCRFANAEDGEFMHPVLRAIILHFWLAYDHPFVDGNGRTARALFYWGMLKADYWLFEYISISGTIYRAHKGYYQSFINTEEDDGDLNYFIFNQLKVISDSIQQLRDYIARKKEQDNTSMLTLQQYTWMNDRQRRLILRMRQHPNTRSTVTTYVNDFAVVRQTARTDLTALVEHGFLVAEKVGKQFVYTMPPQQ